MHAPGCPPRGRPARPVRWVLAGLAAAALLASARPTAADPYRPHDVLREFLPTGRFALVAEPQAASKARVYFSQRAAAFLVRGSALGRPLLVRPSLGTVEGIREEDLLVRQDLSCDLRAESEFAPLGRATVQGTEIHLRVIGLTGRLTPPPPVLGWHKAAYITDHTPEYQRDAKAYVPDEGTIAALRAVEQKVQVFLYFGSWCSTCKLLLGRVLRVEEDLTRDRPHVTFDYYGIPAVPQMYRDPEVSQRRIQKLPTGLVYVDDRFAGTITGTQWDRPEAALRSVLEGARGR